MQLSHRVAQFGLVIPLALSLSACSQQDYGKKTHPVTGEVYVDGQPAGLLKITLHDVNGFDTNIPSASTAMTNEDGTFAISTFEEGDGAPAGEYTATFQWGKLNNISMAYEGDQLNDKYSDAEKSEIRITVTEGEPTDTGRIELTTK
jgi:major membrane immunogen (membrane-anchored lipoprotein)